VPPKRVLLANKDWKAVYGQSTNQAGARDAMQLILK
jgi:hypothetical protein